ncbi:MAG: outer membrane beta-barrel protein [Ginsengibacter sp.]
MKKLLLAIAVIAISTMTTQAQDNSLKELRFSIGVEPSLPIGDFNDAGYNFGIGGSVQGEYKVADDFGLTLNAGYINYSAKDITVGGVNYNGGSFGIVPVLAGFKYYFSPKVYGHGQLGIGIGTSKGASSEFAYSPGIGFMLSRNFDILLKYLAYSANGGTLGSIGARVAYNF